MGCIMPVNTWIKTDKSVADTGCVIMEFGWKGNKETGRVAHARRYISMKPIQLNLDMSDIGWSDFVNEALFDYQQKKIHAFITEQLDSGDNAPVVPDYFFAKSWLLETYDSEQAESGRGKGRLSKEQVIEFFDSKMIDMVSLAIAEKKGFDNEAMERAENVKFMQQAVAQYRILMGKLTELRPDLTMGHIIQAQKALQLVPENEHGMVGKKLAARIDKLLNPPKSEDFLDLLA